MFLRNYKQEIVTECNPYLRVHGIIGSPIEFYSWPKLNVAVNKSMAHFIQVKSKFLSLICFLCLSYQNLCKVLIDTPILLFVRFGQGGFGHYLDTKTVKVRRTKVKCSLYVSQTKPVSKLSKVHYHEPVGASELDSVSIPFTVINILLEFIRIDKKYNLSEYCIPFIHSLQNGRSYVLQNDNYNRKHP